MPRTPIRLLTIAFSSAALLALPACEEGSVEEAAEDTAEQVEETTEDAVDATEDAAEDVADEVEEAADDLEDETDGH